MNRWQHLYRVKGQSGEVGIDCQVSVSERSEKHDPAKCHERARHAVMEQLPDAIIHVGFPRLIRSRLVKPKPKTGGTA